MSGVSRERARRAEERRRQDDLARTLTCAFWRAVQQGEPLPVMAALEAAARALGTLYRQSAAAHGPGGTCGCGWQPDPVADRLVLEAMLATAMRAAPETFPETFPEPLPKARGTAPPAPAEDPGRGDSGIHDLAGMAVAGRA